MTYNVQITAVSWDGKSRIVALQAHRVTESHLEAIIEHIMPLYNPLAHEIIISPNITKEEAEACMKQVL